MAPCRPSSKATNSLCNQEHKEGPPNVESKRQQQREAPLEKNDTEDESEDRETLRIRVERSLKKEPLENRSKYLPLALAQRLRSPLRARLQYGEHLARPVLSIIYKPPKRRQRDVDTLNFFEDEVAVVGESRRR